MENSEIDRMRQGIAELRTAQPYVRDVFWGGAGLVITPERIAYNPDAFYPPPRQLVTAYPSEATWLFESLRDLLAPLIDALSKFEFYERLAIAGERCFSWTEMRNAILDEAERWIDEAAGDLERWRNDTTIH